MELETLANGPVEAFFELDHVTKTGGNYENCCLLNLTFNTIKSMKT